MARIVGLAVAAFYLAGASPSPANWRVDLEARQERQRGPACREKMDAKTLKGDALRRAGKACRESPQT